MDIAAPVPDGTDLLPDVPIGEPQPEPQAAQADADEEAELAALEAGMAM